MARLQASQSVLPLSDEYANEVVKFSCFKVLSHIGLPRPSQRLTQNQLFFRTFYSHVYLSSIILRKSKLRYSCFKYKDISGLIIKFLTRVFLPFSRSVQRNQQGVCASKHDSAQTLGSIVLLRNRIC